MIDLFRHPKQILYVMQGPPGSGKSTIAYQIAIHPNIRICSTDNYFSIINNGVYEFVPEKIKDAHEWNQKCAQQYLNQGYSVVVDNTNTMRWEARPYVRMAVEKGIPVVFIRVNGNFQNIHGVPDEVVTRMRAGMENLDVESVLASVPPWELVSPNKSSDTVPT